MSLPDLIASRDEPHLTHTELVKLMKWKLTVKLSTNSMFNLHETSTQFLYSSLNMAFQAIFHQPLHTLILCTTV